MRPKIQHLKLAVAIPALLLRAILAPAGHSQNAAADDTLTVRGVVAAIDDSGDALLFQLVRTDIRFAMLPTSAADRAILDTALHAAEQTGRSLRVRFTLTGAQFAADRKHVIFPVRALEYEDKTLTASGKGVGVPPPGHEPAVADSAFIRGVGLYTAEKYSEAITELDTALKDGGRDWKATAFKARGSARASREYDEHEGPTDAGDAELVTALQDLREWRNLKPDDSLALYSIAGTLGELGAYPEALEVYAAIARGWSEEAYWSAIRTGATERRLHHYAQALAALDKLVSESGPQEGMPYHYHRGWTLIELGRYADAVEELSQGLRDQPDYAWALVKRACAENLLGEADAALGDQRSALALLKRFKDDSKESQYDLRRAEAVEAELSRAGRHQPAADAKALCGGYWRSPEDLGRSRSSLLPAELPWVKAVAAVAKSPDAHPKYEIVLPADWVQPTPPPAASAAGAASASSSSEFLLVDRQARIDGVSSLYNRFVLRVLNPAGVSDQSQLSIQFNPLSEHLRLHAVTVSRGGETIDELKRGRIEVLRRESRLEQGLEDGELTLHLVMDDVRVGDTIDYSYSLERNDTLWGNRFYAWYPTEWEVSVAASRLRVLVRTGQPLHFADLSGGIPVTTDADGWRTLEWTWHDVPGRPSEAGVPDWYVQHRRIEFSQFADWRDVVNATWPLYLTNAPTPELTALITRFKSQNRSDRERLVAVMRFVQDEIRYTGVELGEGAYRPADAATVLQRRWGDCKEKTLLAVTLLRGVGIQAEPALVNTRLREHVSEWLPSPAAFNHAIVRARLGQTSYWLDATASGQGGTLEKLVQAHYGAALVVRADSTGLEPIPADSAPEPTSMVAVLVDMRRGFDKTAVFTVSTLHRGSDADATRRSLREATAQDLATKYLNFYKQSYAGIRSSGPLKIQDDRSRNELRIDEAYEIDQPFELTKDRARRSFQVEADLLTALLKRPGTSVRTTPLALAFPTNVEQHIRLRLPETVKVEDDQRSVATPTFRYEYRVSHSGTEVLLDYHYQTLAEYVPVEQLADFLAKREQARSDSFFQIRLPAAPAANEASIAEAQKQLATAAQLVQAESWEKADAAFTALLASGRLTELDETKQHAAVFLAALTAMSVGDTARGQDLIKRSTAMASAELVDWQTRLQAAQSLKDWQDAAHSLTTIAQKWPDAVSELESRQLFLTVSKVPHPGDDRYELLKALFEAKFTRPGVDPSGWWRDLALMQIEKGDLSGARESLSALTDPYAMIGVLADSRFRQVRDSLAQRLDVGEAMRRRIESDYVGVKDNPSKLEAVNTLAGDLLAAVRGEEALKVAESAIAKASTPEGRNSFKDYDEQYVWTLDTRAHALFALGRWDDAIAQLKAASGMKEDGALNVSQVINLGELYDRLQRPDDARGAIKDLKPGSMSPFGEMQRADAALSAALQLGDDAESTRLLDYMREHQEDAVGSYEDALIMANRLDDAAELLIARLQDPEKRIYALMAVQHYDVSGPAGSLPRGRELMRRWTEVTGRDDVRAAVAKVGTVSTYALRNEGLN
jgi:tetratricopeptide (TPR) repeat protein/transglutaminase-like putative cysteine protease